MENINCKTSRKEGGLSGFGSGWFQAKDLDVGLKLIQSQYLYGHGEREIWTVER